MDENILKTLVDGIDKYKAHKKLQNEVDKHSEVIFETLVEHTTRTYKYFLKFWNSKQSDKILDRFCDVFWQQEKVDKKLKIKAKNLLKEMIFGIPIFHDVGKINPNFQREKLQVKDFKDNQELKNIINANHSFLSSMIYMDYFLDEINVAKNEGEIVDLLVEFNFYNAYIIERHHSNLNNLRSFKEKIKLDENDSFNKLKEFLNQSDIYLGKIKFDKLDLSDIDRVRENDKNIEQGIYLTMYIRWIYSLLVASDYYATSEFMNDTDFSEIADLDNIDKWNDVYEQTDLMQSIRMYQQTKYPLADDELTNITDINILRSEIFCEVEDKIKDNADENIFYLEAPTGSGKSNTAINASFKLMKANKDLQKIFYIYPFNTLVEQNLDTLNKLFADNKDITQNIAVINSLTPIKIKLLKDKQAKDVIEYDTARKENDEKDVYQKALLDRQFLNYPMILSTHVSLFNVIFSNRQSDAFTFYQLANSVIVLDEIQSYKNSIWKEIICYLKAMAKLFNIKIIIMSATLPNLDNLTKTQENAVILLDNAQRFFAVDCFKNRVRLNFDLLGIDKENILNELKQHLQKQLKSNKKILIEFIKKQTAHDFWVDLVESEEFQNQDVQIEYLSGDDSIAERKRILDVIKNATNTIILVATQVIEAGVDIDMDIGYKNISKLDSEEQFLGRINRSCKKSGIAYFFEVDEARSIYKNDVRLSKSLMLKDNNKDNNDKDNMKTILINKDFAEYYGRVLETTEKKYEIEFNKFKESIINLNNEDIANHMKLIDDNENMVQIYLARKLNINDEVLDGKELWLKYVDLLQNGKKEMPYAEWKVKLSEIIAQMNNFIYEVNKNKLSLDQYDAVMGNMIYIEDGEKYFIKDKFNRDIFQGLGSVSFI